jgi:hypothetical protein
MEHGFDEVIESRLLANDPTVTILSFDAGLVFPRNSTRFALAQVKIFFGEWFAAIVGVKTTHLLQVLEWMESSVSLQDLSLDGETTFHAPLLNLVPRFVTHVIARGSTGPLPLQSLSLNYLDVAANDIVALMQHARLQSSVLYECTISVGTDDEMSHATSQVAESFAANSSLRFLSLGVSDSSEVFLCAVIEALQFPHHLEKLTLECLDLRPSGALFDAMVNLFGLSTGALAEICLDGPMLSGGNGSDANDLNRVVQSISNSPLDIQTFGIIRCFLNDAAYGRLQTVFSGHGSTDCLRFYGPFIAPREYPWTFYELVANPPPRLHHLWLERFPRDAEFHDFLQALQVNSCSIRELTLDTLFNSQCGLFVAAIPHFQRVERISFPFSDERWKRNLMSAFRRNLTLLESNVTGKHYFRVTRGTRERQKPFCVQTLESIRTRIA